MAISLKNKRKLIFNDTTYYWWADNSIGAECNMLPVTIMTADLGFYAQYFNIQPRPEQYMSVSGKDFPGLNDVKRSTLRLACPSFFYLMKHHAVTPGTVRGILEWCFNPTRTAK